MKRKLEGMTIRILCLGIIVLFCINIGCAAAADVTLQMPETVPSVGDTVTIPVILHTDVPISVFSFSVDNTVPHAEITVKKSDDLEGSYTINSNPDASEQYISWYTLTDVSESNLIIGEIVVTTEPGVSAAVPITISNLKIGDSALNNIAESSSLTSPSVLSISGSSAVPQTSAPTTTPTNPAVGTGDAEKETKVPVSVPESQKTDDAFAAGNQNQNDSSVIQQPVTSDIQNSPAHVPTPVGFIPVAAGLFVPFGLFMSRNRRRLL